MPKGPTPIETQHTAKEDMATYTPNDTDVVHIGGESVRRLRHKGQPVTTFEMIAKAHNVSAKTIRSAFQQHRKQFIEGTHCFRLDFTEASSLLGSQVANSQGLVVLTKAGYLLLNKPLRDEKSWKVYAQMIDEYFALLDGASPTLTTRVMTPQRLSRDVEYVITVDDGSTVTAKLRLPLRLWEIASAIRKVALYQDDGKHYRLHGKHIHDDVFPWVEEAVKEEWRRRRATGEAGGKPRDTLMQHLDPTISWSALQQMIGALQMATVAAQKATLRPEKQLAFYKEIIRSYVQSLGITVALPEATKELTFYPNGTHEIRERRQLSFSI